MRVLGLILATAVAWASPSAAQEPDLEITGTVHVETLHVVKAGEVRVEFWGTPKRDTLWETRRVNLPEDVQDGSTYRDVRLDFAIRSTFLEKP